MQSLRLVLVVCAAMAACGGRSDEDANGSQGGSRGTSEVTGGEPPLDSGGTSTGGTQSQGTSGGSNTGGAPEMSGGSSGSSGQSGTWRVTDSDLHPTCNLGLAECGGVAFVADPVSPSAPTPSCELPLPYPPDARTRVNVAVDCEVLPADDPAAGWELHSIENVILLKGLNCERIHSGEINSVSVYYDCGNLL